MKGDLSHVENYLDDVANNGRNQNNNNPIIDAICRDVTRFVRNVTTTTMFVTVKAKSRLSR